MKYDINKDGILIVDEDGTLANPQQIERLQLAIKDTQTKHNNKKIRAIQESKNITSIDRISKINFANGMKLISNSHGLFIVGYGGKVVTAFLAHYSHSHNIEREKDGKITWIIEGDFPTDSPSKRTFDTIEDFWQSLL